MYNLHLLSLLVIKGRSTEFFILNLTHQAKFLEVCFNIFNCNNENIFKKTQVPCVCFFRSRNFKENLRWRKSKNIFQKNRILFLKWSFIYWYIFIKFVILYFVILIVIMNRMRFCVYLLYSSYIPRL